VQSAQVTFSCNYSFLLSLQHHSKSLHHLKVVFIDCSNLEAWCIVTLRIILCLLLGHFPWFCRSWALAKALRWQDTVSDDIFYRQSEIVCFLWFLLCCNMFNVLQALASHNRTLINPMCSVLMLFANRLQSRLCIGWLQLTNYYVMIAIFG
jgi:hypothetical protein